MAVPAKRRILTLATAATVASLLLGPMAGWGPQGAQASGGKDCLKIGHVEHGRHSRICDPLEAPGPPRLSVSASEYKLVLSRPYIRNGKLRLELNNRGQDTHNLQIVTLKGGRSVASVPDVEHGEIFTGTFRIKPGRYRMFCSIPGHAKLGMKARLKVVR